MPEAAQQKDDKDIQDAPCRPFPVAAQRDIDIVREPGGEGDVPALPELLERGRKVGPTEIHHQLHSEEFRAAAGNFGIGIEIGVELEGKEQYGEQCRRAGDAVHAFPGCIDVHGDAVRKQQFEREAPEDEADAPRGLRVVESALAVELRQQPFRPFDGTGDELREEAYESEKAQRTARGRDASAVHIDGIAQRLEGVEADADG